MEVLVTNLHTIDKNFPISDYCEATIITAKRGCFYLFEGRWPYFPPAVAVCKYSYKDWRNNNRDELFFCPISTYYDVESITLSPAPLYADLTIDVYDYMMSSLGEDNDLKKPEVAKMLLDDFTRNGTPISQEVRKRLQDLMNE